MRGVFLLAMRNPLGLRFGGLAGRLAPSSHHRHRLLPGTISSWKLRKLNDRFIHKCDNATPTMKRRKLTVTIHRGTFVAYAFTSELSAGARNPFEAATAMIAASTTEAVKTVRGHSLVASVKRTIFESRIMVSRLPTARTMTMTNVTIMSGQNTASRDARNSGIAATARQMSSRREPPMISNGSISQSIVLRGTITPIRRNDMKE